MTQGKQIAKWGFGMAPLSERMQGRYDYAVQAVLGFLQGSLTQGELDPDQVSELKGMFNRCVRKDQWDWFTVFHRFGEPPHPIMRRIVALLTDLRQAMKTNQPGEVEIVRGKLQAAGVEQYLQAFQDPAPTSSASGDAGWLYILSTREHPDILKIGMTRRSVPQRVKEINAATGVLFPLSPRAVFRVPDAPRAEREVFALLQPYRMRQDREFFSMPFQEAVRAVEAYLTGASHATAD